jgi:hypothetical protein
MVVNYPAVQVLRESLPCFGIGGRRVIDSRDPKHLLHQPYVDYRESAEQLHGWTSVTVRQNFGHPADPALEASRLKRTRLEQHDL